MQKINIEGVVGCIESNIALIHFKPHVSTLTLVNHLLIILLYIKSYDIINHKLLMLINPRRKVAICNGPCD